MLRRRPGLPIGVWAKNHRTAARKTRENAARRNGNFTTLTHAGGNTTTWGYDDVGRPKTATDPLGKQALFAYDAAGHLKQATNRSGLAATAEYDVLGRLKTAKYGVNISPAHHF